VAAISQRRWNLILRAASATALGLGLAAFYLVPAIYEQRWVEIARVITTGMRIQDSFLFERTGMSYHDEVLRTASWVAVLLIAATAIAAVLAWRTRKPQPLRKPLVAMAILITFLLFPTSRFVWNTTPELKFLQFPWRWLLVLGLIFAALAGTALRESLPTRRRKILSATAVLLIAAFCCAHAWKHFWTFCDDEDNIHAQIATFHQQGFEGTDEYTPKPADNGDIQQNLAPVRVLYTPDGDDADSSIAENPDWKPNEEDLQPAIVQIARWQPEHMTAEVQSPQPGYAVLRLMDYPAWRVRLNGKPVPRESRDDGLITVPISAGTSTIDVRYSTTPDVWAGRILSLVSLLLWLWVAAKTRLSRYH
jgi:uncharacterized membrane protein YfhO